MTGPSSNLGAHRLPPLPAARFPEAGAAVQAIGRPARPAGAVDVLLVNPPAPDGGIWIRSQHRVGRRSRENMIWPQVSLAQMAALLAPDYSVEIVDCIATRMAWPEFERLVEEKRPRYYLTQVTAPTLRNDMRGVCLARALGARTELHWLSAPVDVMLERIRLRGRENPPITLEHIEGWLGAFQAPEAEELAVYDVVHRA